MKYAQIQVLPPAPPGGVTAGTGWASTDHVACVAGPAGQVRSRFSAVHDKAGIRRLVSGLRAAGAAEVATGRGEGILVDALLAAGLTVVVITSAPASPTCVRLEKRCQYCGMEAEAR